MSEVGLARSKRCIQEALATDVLCTGHSRGLLVALRSEERLIALCSGPGTGLSFDAGHLLD